MKFIIRIAVLFYVTVLLFLGVSVGLYALNFLTASVVSEFLKVAYSDPDLRIMLGVLSGMILLMNFVFYRIFSVKITKEKVIAFDNPAGRVTVSLQALEDLVKRILMKSTEITDVKPKLSASKKGLTVKIRLILKSDVNIPALTSRVQEVVKRKIQDTIGIDEDVTVSIFVGKIIPEEVSFESEKPKGQPQEKGDVQVPFQGYRP